MNFNEDLLESLGSDLLTFITDNYTEEKKDVFLQTLLSLAGKTDGRLLDDLADLLANDGFMDSSSIKDTFEVLLEKEMDKILSAYKVKLTSESPLRFKNSVLLSLIAMENLEDYCDVVDILDSEMTDEEIFSRLISEFSTLEAYEVMESIEELEEDFVSSVRNFIKYKESQDVGIDLPEKLAEERRLLENLKIYSDYLESKLGHRETIALGMVRSGVRVGEPLVDYLEMMGPEQILKEIQGLKSHVGLLGLILMSEERNDGLVHALETLRVWLDVNFNDYQKFSGELRSEYNNYLGYCSKVRGGKDHD